MSAIEELVSSYHDAIGLGKCEITDNAFVELSQLRSAAAERDGMKDSLQAWVQLWEHICKRLHVGDADTLPNELNFDVMLFERIHERDLLQAVIALNKYVTPPFELTDNDTVRLALECAAKDETIAQQAAQLKQARWLMSFTVEAFDNRFDDDQEFVMRARIDALRDWLAADAPAPEEERTV